MVTLIVRIAIHHLFPLSVVARNAARFPEIYFFFLYHGYYILNSSFDEFAHCPSYQISVHCASYLQNYICIVDTCHGKGLSTELKNFVLHQKVIVFLYERSCFSPSVLSSSSSSVFD